MNPTALTRWTSTSAISAWSIGSLDSTQVRSTSSSLSRCGYATSSSDTAVWRMSGAVYMQTVPLVSTRASITFFAKVEMLTGT
ncbi:hypothetical protein OE88DRAFT_1665601 [Heliocybe sulcata]|uniref:Uncharacterized protein n=1 Tax=Heliocybe sulcata TaxID=5364 RepID=A0A5C3MR47_9AGAM|nr:hypothetical protein OE88DRAFT_1665601 [Heliocybe sulcata]